MDIIRDNNIESFNKLIKEKGWTQKIDWNILYQLSDNALTYFLKGYHELNIKYLLKAIDEGYKHPIIYIKLGELYLEINNLEYSIRSYEESAKMGHFDSYYQLAKLFFYVNNYDKSIEYGQKCLSKKYKNIENLMYLVTLLKQNKNKEIKNVLSEYPQMLSLLIEKKLIN